MRIQTLPLYHPSLAAPERAVLSVLAAALRVAQAVLHDEHGLLGPDFDADALDNHHAPEIVRAADQIVDRCAELIRLIDHYDELVDRVVHRDDEIPF